MSTDTLSAVSSMGFGQFPIELFFIIGAWVVLSGFAFMVGASKLHALGLSVLTTAFLYPFLFTSWLMENFVAMDASATEKILIVGAVLILLYFVYARLCDPGFSDSGEFVTSAVSSLAVVALILAVWAVSFNTLSPFPDILIPIFSHAYFVYWVAGSIAVLGIMHQRRL